MGDKKVSYSLGFLFHSVGNRVLLIQKLHPEWQKGKVNGIGGKLEENEDALVCMIREMEEETGLKTVPSDWTLVGVIGSLDWEAHVYTGEYHGQESDIVHKIDEEPMWFDVDSLPDNCISNLYWLIPLCRDILVEKKIDRIAVTYKSEG